jgi:ABC-type sugar transport system permease subunit
MATQTSRPGAGAGSALAPAALAGLARRGRAGRPPGSRLLTPYLFILPFFLVYGVFLLYPVVAALRQSLYAQTGLSAARFVGLDQYRQLFEDERYLRALQNTTLYALASVFVLSPLALLVAVTVNSFVVRSDNRRSFYRIAFFLPNITSFVVIALMMGLILDTDYGLLNAFLSWVGLEPRNWLRSETLALPAIVGVAIWTYLGINSLYFLAGLQNIPTELTEAAYLDGATRGRAFRDVTLPLLKPTILFVVVQATIFSYQIFEIPFLLTGGGPSDATLTLAIYLYETGFRAFDQGYAAAIGYSLALISVVLSGLQLLLFRAFRNE